MPDNSIDPTKPEPPTPPSKKPLSLAKLRANRANSQDSMGPKTEHGKQVVAMNAVTHGLLTAGVIPAVDGPNAQEQFDRFQATMWAHYRPVGPVEELYVEQIVSGRWQHRRASRCLEAQMAVRVTRKKRARAEEVVGARDDEAGLKARVSPENLLTTAAGVAKVISTLETVREPLVREGGLTPAARKLLVQHCRTELVQAWLANEVAGSPTGTPSQDGRAARLLVELEAELESLRRLEANLREEEAGYEEARVIASALPGVFLDRALRYGTSGLRAAERARNELERLQAKRRGEPMSPEVRLQIDAP